MKYTYTISKHANSSVYEQLNKDIKLFFPEFSFEKETKWGDGSSISFYKSSERHSISAELSFENNNIIVVSDIKLTELEKKYNTSSESNIENVLDARQLLNRTLKTPMGIKAVIIPLCLIIVVFAVLFARYGDFSLFSYLADMAEGYIIILLIVITCCAGLMFIPSAILSDWLAERRDSMIYKLPLSLLLIFCEIFGLVLYAYDLDLSLELEMFFLMGGALFDLFSLAMLYLLLLPLIIADELCALKRKKVFDKRNPMWQSAVWWCSTAAVMIAVFFVFGSINTSINKDNEEEAYSIQVSDTHAAVDPLLAEYEDEMRTVMEYARAHAVYDWSYCPDDSVKSEWEMLFEDDSSYVFDYTLGNDKYNSFAVYIRNENGGNKYWIRFEDDGIYVDGAMYRSERRGEI